MSGRVPDLATLGALIGDAARARMLTSLMHGGALTATELALEANVSPSTASSHLAKLTGAQVVRVEKQGRHRYFALFDAQIAEMLEMMDLVARPRTGRITCPPPLREARVCYDHLAGARGVWLLSKLRERKFLTGRDGLTVSNEGEDFFARLGIDVDALSHARRPLCRPCLDWSERIHHLGGSLGAALLSRIFALRWAERELDGRAVQFSVEGARALQRTLGD